MSKKKGQKRLVEASRDLAETAATLNKREREETNPEVGKKTRKRTWWAGN